MPLRSKRRELESQTDSELLSQKQNQPYHAHAHARILGPCNIIRHRTRCVGFTHAKLSGDHFPRRARFSHFLNFFLTAGRPPPTSAVWTTFEKLGLLPTPLVEYAEDMELSMVLVRDPRVQTYLRMAFSLLPGRDHLSPETLPQFIHFVSPRSFHPSLCYSTCHPPFFLS